MALLEIVKFPHPALRKKAKPIQKMEKKHLQLAKNMLETMHRHWGIGLASNQVHREDVRLIVVDIRSSRTNSPQEGSNQTSSPQEPPPPAEGQKNKGTTKSTTKGTTKGATKATPEETPPPRYLHPVWTELEKTTPMPLILINPKCIEHQGSVLSQEGCLSIPSYTAEIKRKAWVKVSGLNLQGKEVCWEADGLLGICLQHEIDHLNGKLFIDHLSLIKANRIKTQIYKYGYPKEESLPPLQNQPHSPSKN